MSTKELLESIIYPSLYENIADAFPEFGFKQTNGGFQSSTGQKVDHSTGQKGKVYIYSNNISTFIDYTRGAKSIWNYLQERDNLSNSDTLKLLASLAGTIISAYSYSQEDLESLRHTQIINALLESANDFFIDCLSQKDNQIAHGTSAAGVRLYLEQQRKYQLSDLRLPGSQQIAEHYQMELGFIENQSTVYNHLINTLKYDEGLVYDIIKFPAGAGTTHQLTMPFRDPVGKIKGFAFRNIFFGPAQKHGKYLYSPGLQKDDTLFNLSSARGEKAIVLVEGLLDSMLASARGVKNVVALGGTSFNSTQLEQAIKYGVKSITLCFDNDVSGQEATHRAIQIITAKSNIPCYIASIPAPFKDPDEFIINSSIEDFKKIIGEALPWYLYLLNAITKRHLHASIDNLTWKDIDLFLEEATEVAASIQEPIGRNIFEDNFLRHTHALGISKEALQATIQQIKFNKDKELYKKQLQQVLSEATQLLRKNSPQDAVLYLDKHIDKIKYARQNTNFAKLLEPLSEEDVRTKIANQPASLRSGFYMRDAFGTQEELLIPSGALSIIAARTSHGKTAMLMNLALNMAIGSPDKTIHFFSLEEDKEAILIKLLNIFINKDLLAGVSNTKYIKNYFKTDGSTYSNPAFLEGKSIFFNELIATGRINIHYAGADIDHLIGAVKYIHENQKTGGIIIDYIQLLTTSQQFASRQLELQSICNRLLKELAVPTGLPILLGAQFNREVTEEGMMDATKIREAGDIEQTANLILGLWNRAFTNPTKHKDKKGRNANYDPNELYVEILKNRDGQSGLVAELNFNGSTGKIENRII